MKHHRRPDRRQADGHFDEIDDVTAFEFFGDSRRRKRQTRDMQLCRQVQRVIGCTLGECADSVLQDLVVDSVIPAPNASRLMVNVYSATMRGESMAEILRRLARVQGFLRQEVAVAIVRKRAPELLFNVVAPEGGAA